MNWRTEIDDLHAFFEAYFLGTESSLSRLEHVLHPSFSMVGPRGEALDRAGTIAVVSNGHGHTSSLEISITDHRLLHETDDLLVASYIEHHQLTERSNHRLTTVLFAKTPESPNGVSWLRVHETWIDREPAVG